MNYNDVTEIEQDSDVNGTTASRKPSKTKNIISDDQRRNIIEALKCGTVTRYMAAKTFNVSYNTICCIFRQYCREGITEKKKRGGNKPMKMNAVQIDFIKNLLEDNCTVSLKAIKEAIHAKFNISVSITTVHKYVDNFGFSFKRVSRVAAVSLSDELRERRKQYAAWFLKIHNSSRNILFYYETGFQVVMRNTYGRSLKGKKAICSVPSIKSRNITVMATMSMTGLVSYEVLNSACNRNI